MKRFLLFVLLLPLVVAGVSSAKTFPVGAVGKPNAGAIRDAIYAAAAGDTILVHPGIYTNPVLVVANKDLVIRSLAGPEKTILDGGKAELVVWIRSVSEATVLEGFTIRNGYDKQFGGGVRITDSARPVIRNNIIEGCQSAMGGGVYIGPRCKARVEGNLFRGNTATGSGGGLYAQNAAPVIRNNTFVGNNAERPGSAIGLFAASPVIESNLFARQLGLAAVYLMNKQCEPTLRCNGYFGNKETDVGAAEGVSLPGEPDRRSAEIVFSDSSACLLASGSPYLSGPCGKTGW